MNVMVATPTIAPIDGNMLSLRHASPQPMPPAQTTQTTQPPVTFYAGLFEAGTQGYGLFNSDWQGFVNNWSLSSSQGLRLCSIDTDQETEGNTAVLGAYVAMPGGYGLWRSADWDSFQQTFNSYAASMRLLDFDIHPTGGTRFYTGTWGGTPIQQKLIHDLGWDDFNTQWAALSGQGMRLTKVQAFPAVDGFRLTGLFEAGTGGYAFLMTTDWNAFLQAYDKYKATMGLTDFVVYDQAPNRYYLGVWRETNLDHRFIYNLDWNGFTAQWQQLSGQGLRLKRAVRYAGSIELPEANWATYFQTNLAGAAGYAFSVARNGVVVAEGAGGNARTAADAPKTAWTVNTRMHLASVSKTVTAVATLAMLADKGISVDDKFYPLIKTRCPQAAAGVDAITIAQLLAMRSGMVADGTLVTPDIWTFLSQYLQQPLVGTPGQTYAYSNTNFTILQAIIALLADPANKGGNGVDPYVTYVKNRVLIPMGIDTNVFNATPDPAATSCLAYSAGDNRPGFYWGAFNCIGPGGWVSSVRELIKFATGVRANKVLKPDTTTAMFLRSLGWYTYEGIYGQYFHHNGGLLTGAAVPQGLVTGVIHLGDGYDAAILVNSWGFDTITQMIGAFEQRS